MKKKNCGEAGVTYGDQAIHEEGWDRSLAGRFSHLVDIGL